MIDRKLLKKTLDDAFEHQSIKPLVVPNAQQRGGVIIITDEDITVNNPRLYIPFVSHSPDTYTAHVYSTHSPFTAVATFEGITAYAQQSHAHSLQFSIGDSKDIRDAAKKLGVWSPAKSREQVVQYSFGLEHPLTVHINDAGVLIRFPKP